MFLEFFFPEISRKFWRSFSKKRNWKNFSIQIFRVVWRELLEEKKRKGDVE